MGVPAETTPWASSKKGESGAREQNTPITPVRAASSVESAGSVQSGVSFDLQSRVPCGEDLADGPAILLSANEYTVMGTALCVALLSS